MSQYAALDERSFVIVVINNSGEALPPGYNWRACPDGTAPGHIWDGVQFRSRTQAELDIEKLAIVEKPFAASDADRALGEMLYRLNNRVRALEGQGNLSVAQFKALLASFLP